MTANKLAKVIQSRFTALIIMSVVVPVMIILNTYYPHSQHDIEYHHILSTEAANNEIIKLITAIINMICFIATPFIFVIINRQFRPLKSLTWYFVGLYYIIMLAFPPCYSWSIQGGIISFTVATLTLMLFSLYNRATHQHATFIIFFICSLTSLLVTKILFFVPVLIIGIFQMRVFNLKTFCATLLGFITPLWILWGFRIINPLNIIFSELNAIGNNTMMNLNSISIISITLLIVSAIIFFIAIIIKTMSYNANRRVYNTFLELMTITVILIMICDYDNIYAYIPTLTVLSSFMSAHIISSKTHEKEKNIIALIYPLIFIALTVWNYL